MSNQNADQSGDLYDVEVSVHTSRGKCTCAVMRRVSVEYLSDLRRTLLDAASGKYGGVGLALDTESGGVIVGADLLMSALYYVTVAPSIGAAGDDALQRSGTPATSAR